MTIHKFQELKNLALERQKHYMELTGQIDQNGKMLVNVNYIELLKEEYGEYMKATKAMDKLEMADALCDILVCEAGVKIQYDENGKVILDMREFLEDGTKNPKFGKVKKKDITPNLQQFFRK